MSHHISVRWIDTPGLFAGDIRARHMVVELPHNMPGGSNDRIVWRSSFECNGSCQRTTTDEEANGYEGPANELKRFAEDRRRKIYPTALPDATASSDAEFRPHVSQKCSHSCQVRLVVRPEWFLRQ